jgi:hypothetical protein
MMLKLMSQPRTTFMTTAMANMFTPLIRIISVAKAMAATLRAAPPKRRSRYPGTECVFDT